MKTFARIMFGIVIMAGIVTSTAATAAVWYVDVDNVSGTYNGTSWATAFKTIQAGVTAASSGDEVWVAEGTYTRTSSSVVRQRK